jgi:hypothetical protein
VVRRVLTALTGSALMLGGIIAAGQSARDQVAAHERYRTSFHQIACSDPPSRSAGEFLDEVRYLTDLPAALNVLDPGTPDHLTEAFGRHPLVAEVRAIRITAPTAIHVELRFRPAESPSVMRTVSRTR